MQKPHADAVDMGLFGGMKTGGSSVRELCTTVTRERVLTGLILVSGMLIFSCAAQPHTIPVAPGVDFAAHVEHMGLVVDRAQGGKPAVLVPAPTPLFSSGPTYLLETHAKTIAALWVKDPGHVTVRRTSDPSSPVIGRVLAHWDNDDGAISLTFEPANGPELHTDEFERTAGPFHPDVLGAQATTVVDVRGIYQADLRDATGTQEGWLRVRISPYMAAARIYDGVLPASIQEPLATAACALVDADVDYIEDHAVNVYLGN